MEMVNGYVFLDLTKSNVYSKALKVLGADKPVVIKDASGSPYFVDSLTLDGTNVVITKGGKTITIANDNTITNVGDIQNHLYILFFKVEDENNLVYRGTLLTNENIMSLNTTNFKNWVLENLGKTFFANVRDVSDSDNFSYIYFDNNGDDFEINFDNSDTTTDKITTIDEIEVTQLF